MDLHRWNHDMKTCLASIQMGAKLLAESDDPADKSKVCTQIMSKIEDAKKLLQLVKEIEK